MFVCFCFFVPEAYKTAQPSQAAAHSDALHRPALHCQRSQAPHIHRLPGPSASMAEGSLSVSVPAWRLRTDTEIGGGISKLNVANLRT